MSATLTLERVHEEVDEAILRIVLADDGEDPTKISEKEVERRMANKTPEEQEAVYQQAEFLRESYDAE